MKVFRKIKNLFIDYYHIIFKSAAVNHLRIQEILKKDDGSYQLTLRFNSYSELKKYQKKLRRLTVSLSSAVAMVVVAFIVAPYIMNPNRSSAAMFQWTQSSWSTKNQTKIGTYPTDNSNTITNFYDSSGVVVNGNNDVTLTNPVPSTVTDSSYPGTTGFYLSDANGNYSASGTSLALKKITSVSCTNAAECTGGRCDDSLCSAPCGQLTVSKDGFTYGTVTGPDGRCWLDRNLGATRVATAYNDVEGYGWLFQNGRIADGHQYAGNGTGQPAMSTTASGPTTNHRPGTKFYTNITATSSWYSGTSPVYSTLWTGLSGVNNPCPPGFRLPTANTGGEWDTFRTASGLSSCSSNCAAVAYGTSLKLTAAGWRDYLGAMQDKGVVGRYWSSSYYSATLFNYFNFWSVGTSVTPQYGPVGGFPVRCIKNS